MCMGERLHVGITTYNRPGPCLALLEDLARERGTHELDVHVWDDGSTADYAAVKAWLGANGGTWHTQKHGGKALFSKLVSGMYDTMRASSSSLFFQLPDDVRLCRGFVEKALELWRTLPADGVVLTLLVDAPREKAPCWTGVKPSSLGAVERTGWYDGCGLFDRRFLGISVGMGRLTLGSRPGVSSSGVGRWLSHRVVGAKLGCYRSSASLVVHVHGVSQMHPKERALTLMVTRRFVDGEARRLELAFGLSGPIVAGVATMPDREEQLEVTLASLKAQVERITVYRNWVAPHPAYLKQPWITVYDAPAGDLADMGKFWGRTSGTGFQLTCDDDLVYGEKYVEHLLDAWSQHPKAAVGLHGAIIHPNAKRYYQDRTGYPCRLELKTDVWVHVLGTGALGFVPSVVALGEDSAEAFLPGKYMADLWFAERAQKQHLPMKCVAHPAGLLVQQVIGSSIHSRFKANAPAQDELVARVRWKLLSLPGSRVVA